MIIANFPLLTFANHALSAMVFPAGELTHGDNIKVYILSSLNVKYSELSMYR